MTLDAHRDWVVSNAQLDRAMTDEQVRDRVLKISRLDSMLPNFLAKQSKRQGGSNRLLVYNGSGGYGDQIMTWPFTFIMARLGYEVHVCIDPGNQVCWWNMPWVKSTHILPMQADVFNMFDHYALMDAVVNMYEHSPQPHPLDCMLRKVGLEPSEVSDAMKVIPPNFTTSELVAAAGWQQRVFGIYQLAGANPVRNLPPGDSAFLLSKIAEAFPKVTWLAVYDEFISQDYVNMLLVDDIDPETKEPRKTEKGEPVKKAKYPNVMVFRAPNLRELWAISAHAKVIVAPDSMMVHVAGSLSVPCVGLWGAFDPVSRVKYYRNHYPIFNKDACPFAGCGHYLNKFPRYCPPRKDRSICEVMAAISPNQIIDGIAKLVPGILELNGAPQ